MANSKTQAKDPISQFADQVRWLYEPEYGDFKRKVGLYLQRLEETMPELKRGEPAQVLGRIKTKVVYNPNGEIESTRAEILKAADDLKTIAGTSA